MDFTIVVENRDRLLSAALTTILLSGLGILCGLAVGVAIGIVRWAEPRTAWVLRPYVEILRGTPLLVQMFLVYYALPGFGITLDAFPSAVIALGANSSAYVSEIVRGALNSVPRAQWEAAISLGLTRRRAIRRILMPQALIVAIPPISGEFIDVIKWSSVASIVVVAEITQVSTTIVGRTFSFPAFVALAVVSTTLYFVLTSTVAIVSRRFERPVARHLSS
jgi:His/Glu/Gln/Arg/opine family amino acid ABC transporter permease subunit